MTSKNISLLFIFSILFCCFSLKVFAMAEGAGRGYIPYPLATKNLPCKTSAAYTYWAPYSEGLNIAYSEGTDTIAGDTIQPNLTSRSGFKVLIGGTIDHKNFDVSLEYTWFSNPQKTKAAVLIANIPYKTPFDDSFILKGISSAFSNQFNRVNGLLEANAYNTETTILRVLSGCIGAWDFQRLTSSSISAVSENNTLENNFSQNWYAAGPYFALSPTFSIVNHLEFFFTGGTAMLLSKQKTTQNQFIFDKNDSTKIPSIYNKFTFFGVDPMIEVNLGIRSDWMLSDWSVALEISWEIQTYFSHNSFLGFYSPVGTMGSYSMQGLTANFIMDF
jgi:hypothetical protein